MTSRELVRRSLRDKPTPRPTVGPLAVHCTASLADVPLPAFTLNASLTLCVGTPVRLLAGACAINAGFFEHRIPADSQLPTQFFRLRWP